jgi:hypothetical protein
MPTFNTPIHTAQVAALADSSKLVSPTGTLEFKQFPYTLVGTEAANDIINITRLPLGAVVVPSLCSVTAEDPGTTLTLDIGTAENPDGLADGIVLSSGGQVAFTSATMPADALTQTRLASQLVYATVASAASLTANAKLCFNLAWMTPRY